MDQNRFLPDLSYTFSQYLITCFLIAVRHEVNNLESSVVVQELEFAIICNPQNYFSCMIFCLLLYKYIFNRMVKDKNQFTPKL